jgi:RNase P/RNase MRP subunit p30
MFSDIVFPQKNEKQFIESAARLGYAYLCLVYDFSDIASKEKLIKELQKTTKIKLFFGIEAEKDEIQKSKKITDLVIVKSVAGQDQAVLEKFFPDILFDLELSKKRDPLHFRESGLNQVLCSLARKKNAAVGFSFSSMLNSKNKPQMLGRIMQNIRLCRKYRLKTVMASFAKKPIEMRSAHDLMALGIVLGMHASEARSSVQTVFDIIEQNIKKKSPGYIREGVEIIS